MHKVILTALAMSTPTSATRKASLVITSSKLAEETSSNASSTEREVVLLVLPHQPATVSERFMVRMTGVVRTGTRLKDCLGAIFCSCFSLCGSDTNLFALQLVSNHAPYDRSFEPIMAKSHILDPGPFRKPSPSYFLSVVSS